MKKEPFSKQLKKDLKSKSEHKKALFFLFLFICFFVVFYLLCTIFYSHINYFFGYFSSFLLKAIFGVSNTFVFDSYITISQIYIPLLSQPIEIGFLCCGIIEFCLLSSAILASKGISIKKRVAGFLLSIPLIILFNLFRITITIIIVLHSSQGFAEFIHGFLFRVFLVILVVGFYYLWFKHSSK